MKEVKLYRKEDLINDLSAVGKRLSRTVSIYLIGGCAMSLKDLKEFTKDVDIIFTSLDDLNLFENELIAIGYERTLKTQVEYDQLGASSILRHTERAGFDLFHMKVCNMLSLSDEMVKRSSRYDKMGNLEVFLISNEDIALFKGITERPRDIDDISLLINADRRNFNWNTIKEECASQKEHLKIEGHLYNRLLELFEKYQIRAPILSWLKNRDKKDILHDVYEHRLKEGFTHDQIVEQFIKDGFSKKEIAVLDRFGKKNRK
ncbi:hypothetical protein J4450_04530 [Candidatus Micrarchaeota archaeon]|nr:hypothetical protein [Candidatus Micrarchaeota archaeon]